METVLVSNDPVELSWARAVLAASGIEARIFDFHTSLVEGSIGAIPRRLVVAAEDAPAARALLARARAALAEERRGDDGE